MASSLEYVVWVLPSVTATDYDYVLWAQLATRDIFVVFHLDNIWHRVLLIAKQRSRATFYIGAAAEFDLSDFVMALSALRRLMSEYKQLTLNPPEGILAGPISEDNFFEWEAYITGNYYRLLLLIKA